MAIAFTKYIDIISGVGGTGGTAERELIGRIISDNTLVPTGGVLEFTTRDDVLAYFGSTSEEFNRADFYFGFISKNITAPQKISYIFWPEVSTAPLIFGDRSEAKVLASFTSITDGTLDLTLGAENNILTATNFSTATDLDDVATLLTTKIQASGISLNWTAAVVTFNATRGSFDLVGGDTGAAIVDTATSTGGTDLIPANLIGWINQGITTPDGAVFSDGADAQTITELLTTSTASSNNFGSFLFESGFALTNTEIQEAATFANVQNVRFMYMTPTLVANASALFSLISGLGGTAITVSEISTEFPEMAPMMVLAATRYDRRNSVQNYMFQQFNGLTPSVTDTTTSDSLDAIRTNYIGQTQQAGQFLQFYQRGSLTGGTTDPIAQNVFANEIWFKDAAGVAIMNLLLTQPRVSANKTGRALLTTTLQSVIDRALFNGTISVGKILDNTQKEFIGQITGDSVSWLTVQNVGYWFEVLIERFVNESAETEFRAVYTIIYSKDDAIRSVDGSHILI